MNSFFKEIKNDLPASIVVFFVAVPLCLGIALASGAPLFAGIISGIVGGIVCGLASGSWQAFLMAVVLAGVIQLILGYAKAGFIAFFFPSSVIKGMLTGIGLLIILKQIPHAIGWDKDAFGDTEFFQADGENTFSEIMLAFNFINPGAIIIGLLSLAILILWDNVLTKKNKIFNLINGPLVVVVIGIVIFNLYKNGFYGLTLDDSQVVSLPVPDSIPDFLKQFTFPEINALKNCLRVGDRSES